MKKHYGILLFLLCMSLSANGQPKLINKQLSEQGVIKFAQVDPKTATFSMEEAGSILKATLELTQDDDLRLSEKRTDASGVEHRLYEQYYQGVQVEYGRYGVHGKDGQLNVLSGNFKKINGLKTVPTLTEADALQGLLKQFNVKKAFWESRANEDWIKQIKKDPNATFFPKAKLLICQEDDKETLHLAYKFTLYLLEPAVQKYVYLDAHSGEIIRTSPIFIPIGGTADTRYSGTRGIESNTLNNNFVLRDITRGGGINTFDMRNAGSTFGNATDFTDNVNNWTAAEFNNANQDNVALDAHWAIERIYDYWNNVHSRNSYDGNGGTLTNYVHTNLTLFNLPDNDNAFWEPNLHIMVYGDGQNIFNPVTSLDVCAHELGHGVAQFTANFANSGEAAALNEGFSDIWGASVEAYAAPEKQRWLIGEEIMRNGRPCLRSMSNPLSGGNDPNPDVYHGANWNFGNEPHANSTVLSHWFYLLSDGGVGQSNSAGTSYNVSGIGIDKAARIAYQAERNYFNTNPNATYSDARTYMIQAATDLYGSCSIEVIATTNAWYAVGVGNVFSSLDGYYQTGGGNYTLQTVNSVQSGWTMVGPNIPVNWSVQSANPNPPNWFTSGNNLYVNLNSGQSATFTMFSSSASCGNSRNITLYVPGYYRYTVSPNPAKDNLAVEFEDITEEDRLPEEIRLISETSTQALQAINLHELIQKKQLNSKKIEFDVKQYPRGTYYLHLIYSESKQGKAKVDPVRILLN